MAKNGWKWLEMAKKNVSRWFFLFLHVFFMIFRDAISTLCVIFLVYLRNMFGIWSVFGIKIVRQNTSIHVQYSVIF